MNDSAYKYSICGLSIIGPMTKYTEIINTTYGIGALKDTTQILIKAFYQISKVKLIEFV